MANEKSSWARDLTLAILPVFLSVFLFSGMLEVYKNNISTRRDLVIDFYRPMRETQTECRATQNQLFLKHFAQAAAYRLMINEFDHMVAVDPRTLGRDYEVLPKSMFDTNSKLQSEVDNLAAKLDMCTSALYRRYEEVALATGTYDKFLEIENGRLKSVNELYAKRHEMAKETTDRVNVESMLDALRQALSASHDTPELAKSMDLKLHELGDPTIDFFTKLGQNEQDIFKIDQSSDMQLITLFAEEVSRRYKRGLFSSLWHG